MVWAADQSSVGSDWARVGLGLGSDWARIGFGSNSERTRELIAVCIQRANHWCDPRFQRFSHRIRPLKPLNACEGNECSESSLKNWWQHNRRRPPLHSHHVIDAIHFYLFPFRQTLLTVCCLLWLQLLLAFHFLVTAISDNAERSGRMRRPLYPTQMVSSTTSDGQWPAFICAQHSSASNRIIHAKDHASIQINLAEVDETTGRVTGGQTAYAICGALRRMVCKWLSITSDDNWYSVFATLRASPTIASTDCQNETTFCPSIDLLLLSLISHWILFNRNFWMTWKQQTISLINIVWIKFQLYLNVSLIHIDSHDWKSQ